MRFRPMPSMLAVAAASLATAALAPLPSLADGPLSVTLRLGSRCLTGHKPSDRPVNVRLLGSDGTVIEARRDDTTELDWSVCFVGHTPVAGNRIGLVNGSQHHTVVVPDLTISLDRVTNVVTGHAPAGKPIELAYAACDPVGLCVTSPATTVTANSHRRFRKDLSPSVDIDGSDKVRATYVNSHDDRFYRVGRAPFMELASPDRLSLSCLPLGTTTVRLLSATGVLRASRSFLVQRECGVVSGRFRKGSHIVQPRAGDRITSDFAGDATMVLPRVSVAASGYTYSLRCFPDADWRLRILVDGSLIASHSGTTDANGRSSIVGYQLIPSGATLRLACESSRGDRVAASAKAS